MTTKQNKKSALIIATLSAFLGPYMGSSINIALPDIGETFSMSAISLGWVATSYILTAAVFLIPFGRLADIYGRKKNYIIGISIFTLSSLLCAVAHSQASIIVYRVIQGIGSAFIFSTGTAILVSVYPPNERGRVLGINAAAVYIGLSIGPFLGGILTQAFGWRAVFWVNVPVGILLVLLSAILLKGEWAEAKGEKFDLLGSIILIASLTALILGMGNLPHTNGVIMVIAGILGVILFVVQQMRVKYPLIKISLFTKNRVFAFSNLAAFINYSATFAITFLLSLYLQHVKGFDAHYAGTILVAQPIVMALFSPIAGKLSDKTEPRFVASVGMALVAIGLFLLIFVNSETTTLTLVLYLMLLGLGFALFSSPNTNAVMTSVDKKTYGIASSILGTMRLTGQMFSMGIAMLVFSITLGKAKITPDLYDQYSSSMSYIFVIFTVLCVFGVFASLARGKVHKIN
ncbi:MAG TPA: MFS transporter [Salinivirgaceae bacterium]|nr:MFS transporter [Salinivirgaceae bacterium]HQA75590.1 MFS transporter [Salinivirgaceae bacterium]